VGIQLGYNQDKRLVVVAPLKDTPADKAGIKPGDLIIKINNKDTSSISLPEAVNEIRGQKGTQVALTVFGENDTKPRDVSLTRDTIVVKSAVFEAKTTPQGKKVAYIRLSSFGDKTKDEWDDAVSAALASAPQGVIVDVRNNPGGYLDDAVYIASEFLPDGNVMLQEDAQGNRTPYPVVRRGKMLTIPVLVLINKGSASASEILSGSIQDHKRGKLLGEQSFGKGTIQSAEDLPENTGIHVTTAKWLTPDGRWVHGVGLTPDIKVELPADGKKDTQLDKALETLDAQ
jgi:carboxyl-terminal processing protease